MVTNAIVRDFEPSVNNFTWLECLTFLCSKHLALISASESSFFFFFFF